MTKEFKKMKTKLPLIIFYIILILSLASDLIINKHCKFPWEKWFGFYALFGFLASILLIIIAKVFKYLVNRDEDYYNKL